MTDGTALTAHEVGDEVDRPHEDDQIAERHDLLPERQRDDVAEHHQHVVGFFEMTAAGEDHAGLRAAFDDTGLHERLGTHRHARVQHDRHDVAAQADRHDAHTRQVEVGDREPREQHEREQEQRSRAVTFET